MLTDIIIKKFIFVDDFITNNLKEFIQESKLNNEIKRFREHKIHISEVIAIFILYQSSKYRNFKAFYENLENNYDKAFPKKVSYGRFVELKTKYWKIFLKLSKALTKDYSDVNFVDSTKIEACHNKRRNKHKVLKSVSDSGKSSMGWFYGSKLHMILNNLGEIVDFDISTGSVHDINFLKDFSSSLQNTICGDKGYISKDLETELSLSNVTLLTYPRKNMEKVCLSAEAKQILKDRVMIERFFNVLKNVYELVHSRHRSLFGFYSHIYSILIAYSFQDKKIR